MRQRIMIAMALLCQPKLLIADEPTTALDVTIQAQILDLFAELKADFNTGLILITHDLGVVAGLADRVAVMYAGRMVEIGEVVPVFDDPKHPYTEALLSSTPRIDRSDAELKPIPGRPPNLQRLPAGCAFEPRCSKASDRCGSAVPPLVGIGAGRQAACTLNDLTGAAS
jgi:oligopeptide transport system ATP-binding protein